VLTGAGDRAFCSGGNTREYASYYAGRPREYQAYMRLFNDAVNAILHCDVPVVNRVNGLRVAGGQELGMACDFSVAQDLARFGQAGPRHGSAPDGGATDFLHLFVGIERALEMCALCDLWSAHKSYRLGMLADIAPALFVDGEYVANPLVHTQTYADAHGRIVHGEPLEGAALAAGKEKLKRGKVKLDLLDAATDRLVAKFVNLFPGCLLKTVESMRKKKLEHWDKNAETNRLWLALNMTTEAKAGFTAFERGGKREVDFVKLRLALAEGRPWSEELIAEILPPEAR
jgi:6-oxo-cyclohex-1-ene-carbonyl-CoA hydrolase